jgi:hypothetical protein
MTAQVWILVFYPTDFSLRGTLPRPGVNPSRARLVTKQDDPTRFVVKLRGRNTRVLYDTQVEKALVDHKSCVAQTTHEPWH